MKPFSILALFIILGCKPEMNESILADKYVDGFNRLKYLFANNLNVSTPKNLPTLIDTIISQTKTADFSPSLRKLISIEIDKISLPRTEDERERYFELLDQKHDFVKGSNDFLSDLDFIDRFLQEVYWSYWQCNIGVSGAETLLSIDTVILQRNKEYEIPIRIEYNGLPSSGSIISNSIQGQEPNRIKFKTEGGSNSYQTVKYQCEVINQVTNEVRIYKDSLVIKLVTID